MAGCRNATGGSGYGVNSGGAGKLRALLAPSHLLHMLFVEDFLHDDELDHVPGLLVERGFAHTVLSATCRGRLLEPDWIDRRHAQLLQRAHHFPTPALGPLNRNFVSILLSQKRGQLSLVRPRLADFFLWAQDWDARANGAASKIARQWFRLVEELRGEFGLHVVGRAKAIVSEYHEHHAVGVVALKPNVDKRCGLGPQ